MEEADENDPIYDTIVFKLIKLFDSDCLAEEWLSTPQKGLEHKTPMDLIRDGKVREILAYIESLEGKYLVQ